MGAMYRFDRRKFAERCDTVRVGLGENSRPCTSQLLYSQRVDEPRFVFLFIVNVVHRKRKISNHNDTAAFLSMHITPYALSPEYDQRSHRI